VNFLLLFLSWFCLQVDDVAIADVRIFTLGVGGVDPVNNIILYIKILYIIYTYTAYSFPIRAASSRSAYL